ncbi:hypothetical protein LOC68_04175 [Blastopirellula sp. JC732]|uniref:Uncharacterized protein n=1 Tax=Blastopirellula sediminis TaxID=2894196 RepID=A0A9X1MIP0_9BACT|nr:hypothetical protein [Blastopirellula sediminis]MCC9609645.1 hypothetical protein [Blastopirellula sediminis]MCC9627579.1 hypothetical protein [Blastopirellula sediminis]
MQKLRTGLIIVGYFLIVVAVIGAMSSARSWALAELDTADSREQWSDFRHRVQTQMEEGGAPVARSVPKSAEPPTFVLLRDHFYVLLAFVLLISTLLYWVSAWMFSGALRTSAPYGDSRS